MPQHSEEYHIKRVFEEITPLINVHYAKAAFFYVHTLTEISESMSFMLDQGKRINWIAMQLMQCTLM